MWAHSCCGWSPYGLEERAQLPPRAAVADCAGAPAWSPTARALLALLKNSPRDICRARVAAASTSRKHRPTSPGTRLARGGGPSGSGLASVRHSRRAATEYERLGAAAHALGPPGLRAGMATADAPRRGTRTSDFALPH